MALLFPRLAVADERNALRISNASASYRDLGTMAGSHLSSLEAAGCRPGDRIGVWTQPELATAAAIVGNALGGFVSVPLNPKLGSRELEHIIGDSAPARLVAADEAAAPAASVPTSRIELGLDGVLPERKVDDEPLFILYTSGTTGAPKGALITARNVASNLDALADAWQWTDADDVVHALPLFHVHGLILGLFGSLRVGGGLHHIPRFDSELIAAALGPSSLLFAVPTMYHRLVEACSQPSVVAGLRRARLLVSGSAGLPRREHDRIAQLCGRGVHERYGLTETLINCAVRGAGPPDPGYVGPPLRGIELQVVAQDGEVPRDDETMGEVAVRGPNVFAGYLNRPEATAEVLRDGWFYTGDLATRRSDGTVRIVGRKSVDLIKTGGFKVGAGEVESALLEHPAVAEVAVIGVPDDDLGERIVAFVVARDAMPSSDELVSIVAERLTPHKRPREVRFVSELPRNAMGKVQKAKLRENP